MEDGVFGQVSPIPTFENVTPQIFRDTITPRGEPVILKGVVRDWPSVHLAATSDEALAEYLKSCDSGKPTLTLLGDPSIKGEFFYGDTLDRCNFQSGQVAISIALTRLLEQRAALQPYAVYVQSTPIEDHLPRFLADHPFAFVPEGVSPRIWIGNQLRVQTHYDMFSNIACVVAGRRRFTLFPPEQLVNLYPGPLDKTIAGAPVSMVNLEAPDFGRYPRFAEALKYAQTAELEAGDAIYIPYFWWHHVRSLSPFNVLVNYWWDALPAGLGKPIYALMHGLLSLRDLAPPSQRGWKAMFDYYVFGVYGDPVAHLKPEDKGPLGPLSDDQKKKLRSDLIRNLRAQWPDAT
jgi:hypothetical protein